MKKQNLESEGIPAEFVDSVDLAKRFSPVQLEKEGNVVSLVKCSTGYWISPTPGVCLKENGKYVVITEKEAKIARARYLYVFKEQIKEELINNEYERLKNQALTTAKDLLQKIKALLLTANLIERSDLYDLLHSHLVEKECNYEAKVAYAKEICEKHDLLSQYNNLKALIDNEDYDQMYISLVQEGLPMLGSFDASNTEALKNIFHTSKVEHTLHELSKKGYLYTVAKINVEKKETSN